jgi:hypothetical protein
MKKFPFEGLVWIAALAALALSTPETSHITLCPFAKLGFDFCPGCGLGRSISFAFHGEFEASLHTHPLGLFAIFILTLRIITLFKIKVTPHGKSNRLYA